MKNLIARICCSASSTKMPKNKCCNVEQTSHYSFTGNMKFNMVGNKSFLVFYFGNLRGHVHVQYLKIGDCSHFNKTGHQPKFFWAQYANLG